MTKSPPITITSDELRLHVEDHLDCWIPDRLWARAEAHARRKLDHCRESWPEIDHYDNDYLVLLAADAVHETAFRDFTIADYEAKLAARSPA